MSFCETATRLENVHKTILPAPLVRDDEFDAFYRSEVNKARGGDKIGVIATALAEASGGAAFKALFMGHSGVGKSTELTRLARRVVDRFQTIRFSATEELDPVAFQPFDVLLLMMAEIAVRTARPVKDGGAGQAPGEEVLQGIWNWFATEENTKTRATEMGARLEVGVGAKGGPWWAKALGLFAAIRGEIKFGSARQTKTIEYRLSRLSELIGLANELLDDCNSLLRSATDKDWLFIGEDFDKAGIPPERVGDLFITYGNVIRGLQAHMVFVIPIDLAYSGRAVQLPIPNDRRFVLPDTPVFKRRHEPDPVGRDALRQVLEARVAPELFAEGQADRLIVASGGNLRDFFSLVSAASQLAKTRGAERMEEGDCAQSIRDLRTDYRTGLGQSPYDIESIAYAAKAERLVAIYNGDPESDIPDPVLYSLLRSKAVQEFNGERWFGVHPLVVDVLESQERLVSDDGGPVAGGTRREE